MKDVVNRVFPSRVAERIEETKGEIATGVDSHPNLACQVAGSWSGPCAANWAREIGITNAELIIITCERSEILGLDLCSFSISLLSPSMGELFIGYLQGIVHIGACKSDSGVDDVGKGVVRSDPVVQTDGSSRGRRGVIAVNWHRIIEGHIARDGGVVGDIVEGRSTSGPQDD